MPASDFVEPDGAFLILEEDGVTVAGGAIRRYDPQTAEVKRVWTSHRHRRRGLARRVMAELEAAAAELGYQRIHLTTGPRQPEARSLYLAAGYTPRFDATADPETIGPLAFAKELVAGAGLPEWERRVEVAGQAGAARSNLPDPGRRAPAERFDREDRPAGATRRRRRSPACAHQAGQRSVPMSPARPSQYRLRRRRSAHGGTAGAAGGQRRRTPGACAGCTSTSSTRIRPAAAGSGGPPSRSCCG